MSGTNSDLLNRIEEANAELLNIVYPVGICIEFSKNVNPNELYIGQKWIPDAKGKVVVGVDESDYDFNEVDKTGGEKLHQLSIYELPKDVWHSASGFQNGGVKSLVNPGATYGINTQSTNFSQPHNNLQPYITRYKWTRVF